MLFLGPSDHWPDIATAYIQLLLAIGSWLVVEQLFVVLLSQQWTGRRKTLLVALALVASVAFALMMHSMQTLLGQWPWAFPLLIAALGFRGLTHASATRHKPWSLLACTFLAHTSFGTLTLLVALGDWIWIMAPLAASAACLSVGTRLIRDALSTPSRTPFGNSQVAGRVPWARCYTLSMLLSCIIPTFLALLGFLPASISALMLLAPALAWLGEQLEVSDRSDLRRAHLYVTMLIATLFLMLGIRL